MYALEVVEQDLLQMLAFNTNDLCDLRSYHAICCREIQSGLGIENI